MLLGFIKKDDTLDELVPVFVPSHLTCLLGRGAYDALLGREVEGIKAEKRDETVTEVLQEEGKDPINSIEEALKAPHPICCAKLLSLDEETLHKIAETFPDESIFILAENLSPFGYQTVSDPRAFGRSADDCFDDWVGDVTGYRPKKKETVKKEPYQSHFGERIEHPLPEPLETPKQGQYPIEKSSETAQKGPKIEKEDKPKKVKSKSKQAIEPAEKETPSALGNWTTADVKRILKRDLLNLLFAIIFLMLTFATSIGFFFLATDSRPFFDVMCVIMVIVFPILSAIPIGFIYIDNGRRLRPLPLPLFAWLTVYAGISLLCAFILLALGNGNGWDLGKVTFHFFMHLSPLLWAGLRIALDPLLRRLKKAKK